MNISDETSLREQLHEAAPQPVDTDIDELIRRGLRIGRRRRVSLVASTAAVAAVAIAFAGVAGFDNDSGPAKNAMTSSHPKYVRPTVKPGATNMAPVDPACPNWRYEVVLNGRQLPDRDEPLSLGTGQTVDLQIRPGPGQLAISDGTAQMVPAHTGRGLTASDTTSLVNGVVNDDGAITYRLPLTTPEGISLPAGIYMLVMPYTTPCVAAKTSGGEMYITVNLH